MMFNARCFAMCATLIATSGVAQAGTFYRVTGAGRPVEVASHATWDAECIGGPALVEIVVPPQHGRAFGIERSITITRIEAGSGACRGRRIEAETVIYKPGPGFHGQDQFAYTSTTSNGTVLPHQVTVRVR